MNSMERKKKLHWRVKSNFVKWKMINIFSCSICLSVCVSREFNVLVHRGQDRENDSTIGVIFIDDHDEIRVHQSRKYSVAYHCSFPSFTQTWCLLIKEIIREPGEFFFKKINELWSVSI